MNRFHSRGEHQSFDQEKGFKPNKMTEEWPSTKHYLDNYPERRRRAALYLQKDGPNDRYPCSGIREGQFMVVGGRCPILRSPWATHSPGLSLGPGVRSERPSGSPEIEWRMHANAILWWDCSYTCINNKV